MKGLNVDLNVGSISFSSLLSNLFMGFFYMKFLQTLQLLQANTGMCLQGTDIRAENETFKVLLANCSENNKYQKWILFPIEWWH